MVLQRNYEFWIYFISTLTFWAATGFAIGGANWLVVFVRVFLLLQPANGWIYAVTYSMAWFTFTTILYARRSLGFKGLILAGAAPFGGVGLFEVIYVIGLWITLKPTVWVNWINTIVLLNLAAWIALGFTGVFYWKINKLWQFIVAGYATLWVVWVASGYQQITWGTFAEYPFGYIFNVVLKILSFLLFALPLWYIKWRV